MKCWHNVCIKSKTMSCSCMFKWLVYIFRSESFKRFGLSFYAYLCLDLQQITDVTTGDLYKYYRATGKSFQLSVSYIK